MEEIKNLEHLRYSSFLNAIGAQFHNCSKDLDSKTQRRMLGFAIKLVDTFSDMYGDCELRRASNNTSKSLSLKELSEN